jgi:hypothetical protein
VVSVGVGVEALTDLATSFSFTVYLHFSARRTVVFVFILLESVSFLLARSGLGLRFARHRAPVADQDFPFQLDFPGSLGSGPVRTHAGSRRRPRRMVNKFGTFCRNSLKFDGFGPVRIQKSLNLLFINSKNKKNQKKYVKN